MGVLVDAPKRLFLVLARDARKACARRVDEHQVACVEDRIVVVDDAVGRGRRVTAVISRHHLLGTERAHVQPHGRGAGAAVVNEGHRPVGRRDALLEIGHVEHRGLGLGVAAAPQVLAVRALFAPRRVVPAPGVNDDRAGDCVVVDLLPTDGRGPLRVHMLRLEKDAGIGLGGRGRRRLLVVCRRLARRAFLSRRQPSRQ